MLEKGTNLAGYRVTGVIGQGGMGVVYEASQLSLNRTVALKVLAAHLGDDMAFRERFRREGQIQAALEHPNIVAIYEAGESEYGLFIAMRLIRGPNLKDMVVGRELDAGRALRILSPVAEALDIAHEAGLIHRDIKPQNILVGGRDRPFLADFGLTKGPAEQTLTKTGQFVGTIDYISPEQIQGQRATNRSDIYALAAVLYECLTGVVPYPKDSEAAVLYAQLSDPPPRLTDERPELPASLDDVISKGMAKDPAERYGTAGELLQDAERAFTKRLRAAMTPPGPIEVPQETGMREAEVDVPTREVRTPPVQPQEPATAAAGDAAPAEETRAAAEQTAPAAEVTQVPAPPGTEPAGDLPAPAEPTRAAPAPVEPPPEETKPSEPPEIEPTRVASPEETRLAAGAAGAATRPAQPPRGVSRPPAPEAAGAGGTAATVPLPRRRPAGVPLSPAVLGAAAAALLAIAIIGFLVGHSGGGGNDAAKLSSFASAGSLDLAFPSNWERVDKPPKIPGLAFKQPIALSPRQQAADRGLIAGQVAATGRSLLPQGFLRLLPAEPSRDHAVRLGKLEAYRYSNLKVRGFDRQLTLYVAPSSAGVATVACTAKGQSAGSFFADCEHVATSLKLAHGKAYPLGPDETYGKSLSKVISGLNSARSNDRSKLKSANTAKRQAKYAKRLAKSYRTAAGQLGKLSVSPAAADIHRALRGALSGSASAYNRLASAASKNSRARYNSAKSAVSRNEQALQKALKRLQGLGFKLT